jgi:hypothetical protein
MSLLNTKGSCPEFEGVQQDSTVIAGQSGVASVTRNPEIQKIWIAAFAAMTSGEALVFS